MNTKIEVMDNFDFFQSNTNRNEIKQISTTENKQTKNVELTQRDFEIIQFIIEMKFSSVDEVFQKFFKVKLNSEPAKSQAWAKKRLQQLEKARFLKSMYSFSESTRLYVGTYKGYYALAQIKPLEFLVKPHLGFDQRVFSHDLQVLNCRLQLEESKSGLDWISERKLKSDPQVLKNLTQLYIPDGVYTSISGQKVAFELEIAIKAKSRYKDKIKKYINIIRSEKAEAKLFDRVHYVCAKDTLKSYLIKETRIYGAFFKIETLAEFLSTNGVLV